MSESKTLAIIPARGGSKGVPRKNVRSVGGRPLILWTIQSALKSCVADNVVVSTDDGEIKRVAEEAGAFCQPRPVELAGDKTPMYDVVKYVIESIERERKTKFDSVILLQPTAPRRTSEDINAAVEMIKDPDIDCVISVYQVDDCHPSRMYTVEEGQLVAYTDEPAGSLRQDLATVYHRNGAIYLAKRRLIEKSRKLWGGRMVPFIMPRSRSLNIDDEFDLKVVDLVMGADQGNG